MNKPRTAIATLSLALLFASALADTASAQVPTEKAVPETGLAVDPFGTDETKKGDLEPAELKTDSDSQEILVQADVFVRQERYDLASMLWQKVIDESGDQVFSRDDWKDSTLNNFYKRYKSVNGGIEATLAKLPPQGLAAYRLKADGEARALLNSAGVTGRESALAEVVRRFFLSKMGDEAAFELACLKLDRGEFLPAARLLAKVSDEYPDSTVPQGEIDIRLAAVSARVGDVERAKRLLASIKSKPIPSVPLAVIKLVEADIAKVSIDRSEAVEDIASWTMPFGGPRRTGLMPAPKAPGPHGLILSWHQGYQLSLPEGKDWDAIRKALAKDDAQMAEAEAAGQAAQALVEDPFGNNIRIRRAEPQVQRQATYTEVVGKWKEHGWLPVGQVLMHDGKIYFKTHKYPVCFDAKTGEFKWFGSRSSYPADPNAASVARARALMNRSGSKVSPAGEREIMGFDDMLNQSMVIVGDKLLSLQGKPTDFFEDGALDEAGMEEEEQVPMGRFNRFNMGGGAGAANGRTRENRLFAYDLKTEGIRTWILSAKQLLPESKRKVAFAGTPVPYGSLAVVPVYEGTSLWLFGINPKDGKPLWKSFIADEPPAQTSRNSPVRIAIDGGEAYVATGSGVAASLDAISGTLNWAVTYPRTSADNPEESQTRNMGRFYGGPLQAELDGWKEDTIIASGNAIVFAASDFNHLTALDRRSGELLWDSAIRPIDGEPGAEYVLGIDEGVVCVAGTNVVRGYQLTGGRLLWENQLAESSTGRGMLTGDGIYLPLAKSILQLSVTTGDLLATIPVETGPTAQPLGNLFTDGESIFSIGYRQMIALRPRAEGEELPKPEPKPVGANQLDPYDALTMEAVGLIQDAYTKLSKVRDAAAAREAGERFDEVGDQLVDISKRMAELGEPPAEKRASLAKIFDDQNRVISAQFTESLGRIITVEDAAGDILEKVVNLNKKVESVPIMKAYGIDLARKPKPAETRQATKLKPAPTIRKIPGIKPLPALPERE